MQRRRHSPPGIARTFDGNGVAAALTTSDRLEGCDAQRRELKDSLQVMLLRENQADEQRCLRRARSSRCTESFYEPMSKSPKVSARFIWIYFRQCGVPPGVQETRRCMQREQGGLRHPSAARGC